MNNLDYRTDGNDADRCLNNAISIIGSIVLLIAVVVKLIA